MLLPEFSGQHMATPLPDLSRNLILGALAAGDLAALRPHLEAFDMRRGVRLSPAGTPIRHAYFPCSGMISLVQNFVDGSTTEVGIIGVEGFWGTPILLGARSAPTEAMVQAEGFAVRLKTKDLLALSKARPTLCARLLSYAQVLHVQVSMTAACNGRHALPQRLARWLLETDDRLGDGAMPLTHEFLSYMLGVRRAGVSTAMHALATRGVIKPSRNRIEITNRAQLEAAACECYRIVKAETRRLTPRNGKK